MAKWIAIKLPIPPKITISQYNFNGVHIQIKEKIQKLLKEQIIVPVISPHNNPNLAC